MHPVGGARPQIPVLVAAKAVGEARRDRVEDAAVSQTLLLHGEDPDVLHRIGHELQAALGDVEERFVGREAEAVRSREIVGHDREGAVARIEPVDRGGQLGFLLATLVIRLDAVGRIREPDRAVGLADEVVGRVQALAAIAVGQDCDASIELGPGDAAAPMRAGDQPPLPVAGMAVLEVRGRPEDAQTARLAPAHDAVVRQVAEQQFVPVPEPDRALAPPEALGEHLQRRVRQDEGLEARVAELEGLHAGRPT
ncbi:hypothetical protein AEGHOMDF_5515 [Methylobacterium soli]|nr:hypothetical protein AEGHOMDF_5515 [Methylobacterium soli]